MLQTVIRNIRLVQTEAPDIRKTLQICDQGGEIAVGDGGAVKVDGRDCIPAVRNRVLPVNRIKKIFGKILFDHLLFFGRCVRQRNRSV